MKTELGKIKSVKIGLGGCNDCMFGLHISFRFRECCGASWEKTEWDSNKVKHSERCEWSEEDRQKQYAEIMYFLSDTLNDAKCKTIDELVSKPVELTFDGNLLKSWRILTEVL